MLGGTAGRLEEPRDDGGRRHDGQDTGEQEDQKQGQPGRQHGYQGQDAGGDAERPDERHDSVQQYGEAIPQSTVGSVRLVHTYNLESEVFNFRV